MKLLMENWREFLNEEDEEQLEEGLRQTLMALGLLGASMIGGQSAQADTTAQPSGEQTHQVQSIPDGHSNVGNIHTFKVSGVTIDFPNDSEDVLDTQKEAVMMAKAGLAKALKTTQLSGVTVKPYREGNTIMAIATYTGKTTGSAQQTQTAKPKPATTQSRTSKSDW
jgi:hypothetical protein